MKLLIWDFDGTLGYREGGAWAASLLEVLRRELPAHGATLEDLKPYTTTGFRWQVPERAYPPVDPGDAATVEAWWDELLPLFEQAYRGLGIPDPDAGRLARLFRPTYLDPARWRRFEDVEPALRSLSHCGWTHVILSNHVPELPEIVRAVGLNGYFARIFNSAEMGYEKPHPRVFQTVREAFPDAEACWMIGDSYHADVLGAEAQGIPAVWVCRASSRSRHPEAQFAVETLSDLAGLLTDNEGDLCQRTT